MSILPFAIDVLPFIAIDTTTDDEYERFSIPSCGHDDELFL